MKKGIFYFRFDCGRFVCNLSTSAIPALALTLCSSLGQMLDNKAVQLMRLRYQEGIFDIRRNTTGSYDWKCAFSLN